MCCCTRTEASYSEHYNLTCLVGVYMWSFCLMQQLVDTKRIAFVAANSLFMYCVLFEDAISC
jgi:hypothetical protein